MILAAGLGTRLRPLTDKKPKALVELHGVPVLEIVIERLKGFGVREMIINVFHFSDMIADFLRKRENFSIRIELSHESTLLDTGGGLQKAAWFFEDNNPFILHNVDVISSIDFNAMLDFHESNKALATIAVQQRNTQRYIAVDEHYRFRGRFVEQSNRQKLSKFAFNGVHIISPTMLPLLMEKAPFSIIDAYVRLANSGESIFCYDIGDTFWRDVGKPDSLRDIPLDYLENNN